MTKFNANPRNLKPPEIVLCLRGFKSIHIIDLYDQFHMSLSLDQAHNKYVNDTFPKPIS